MVKNCDQGLESAARGRRPRAAFSSPRSQFLTIRTDLSRQITCLFFFPPVNWLYRLQISLFTQLLSFSGLPRHLPTICKKSWQRTSNSDNRQKKDVLKNRLFELLYVSRIYFTNFELSLKFYYKNNFCPSCMLSKSIESDLATLH